MTIRQQGGVFGRNPVFNDAEAKDLTVTNSMNVDNGTLQVDPVNNRVGVKIAPATDLHVYNPSSLAMLRVEAGANSAYLNLKNSTRSWNIYSDSATGKLSFFDVTFGVERMALSTSGNLSFASGKGIDFSATSGTGTSELFDDYEEGTWTPVPADAETGGNTGTAGTANGYYTKVGNVVHVMGVLVNVNTAGLTAGNLFYIQGLPFASKDLSGATAYYLSGGVLTSLVTITGNVQMYLGDLSKTAVGFYDAGGNILVSDLTSGAADFYFSLTYMAS